MVYSVFSIIEFVIYSLLLITDWKVLAIGFRVLGLVRDLFSLADHRLEGAGYRRSRPHTLLYPALTYPNLPYPTLTYPTLPYPTLPDWKVLAIDEADPMAAKINDIDDLEKMLPGKVSEVRGSRFVRAIIITRMQERHAAVKRI